jgi:hypothetical protein
MPTIEKGQIVALFAFDLGYEVSLEKLKAMIATTPVQPLSRKKQTPTYLQYTKPPHKLNLGIATGHFSEPGDVQALIFDFGAVSVAYRWKVTPGTDLRDLPRISHDLYNLNLEPEAREQAEALMKKIEPAISRPRLAAIVEDYYLYIIEAFDTAIQAEELIGNHRGDLSRALRFEVASLSRSMQDEAVSQSISYYENDLTIIDWNAAVIYDRDYEDTANVLELLNVELLEARYIDGLLDKQIDEYGALVRKRTVWPIPLRTPYKKAIQDLAELRIEASLLSERVENALKLVGDQYLARLHSAATQKFYLHEWEQIISRKLEIISDFYQFLNDRLHTSQSQALELIIVFLIMVELVLAFSH